MEVQESRHRKSRSVSGFDGKSQNQKQQFTSRWSSDSHFCTDGSKGHDMFNFQSGRRSCAEASGLSMNNFLDKEMSKEVSHKKQTPSIVARLMGVEGLPSPEPFHIQQRKFSNFYQHKNDSLAAHVSSRAHDSQSWRSSVDQEECKDVYEDIEASCVVNHRCSPSWNKRFALAKPDMSSIQQKLFDAEEEVLSSGDSIQGLEDLVMKRPHAPQIDSRGSYGSPIAVLKPLSSEKYERSAKVWRPERHIKRRGGHFFESDDCQKGHLFRSSLDQGTEENMLPTRIVLLKPKQRKIKNSGASCSSASLPDGYQLSYQNARGYSNVRGAASGMRTRERQITMKMFDSWDESVDAKSTLFGGYTGDESSYEESEGDSGSDYEIFQSPCRTPLWEGEVYAYPSSVVEGSSNTSSKKTLYAGWKGNHKYHGFEMVRNGRTLAERLASNPTAKSVVVGGNNRFSSCNSRMSSPDDWKDHKSLSSFRSGLLSESFGGISNRKCTRQSELAGKQHVHNGAVCYDRKNATKGKLHNKYDNFSDLCGEQPHFCQWRVADEMGCSTNTNLKIQTKEKPVIHGSWPSGLPRAEPDSSERSKEADHPSPVSVLEVPRHDDTSFSESFERVNAELHELRKKLQLLKMEPTSCAETPPPLPIEEETTSSVSDNFHGLESESWKTSYANDVLIEAAAKDSNFSISRTTWKYSNDPLDHSNDPLDPKLFNSLETKYNNGMMGSKSERKLLFDVIKSSLLEILQDHAGSLPWVQPKLADLYWKSEKEAVRDAIEELMSRDFFNWEASESEELDKEMEWSEMEGEINLLGIDMEKLLIDEMISELCSLY